MQRTPGLIITFFFILLFGGCSSLNEQSWIRLIPQESSFIIVPKSGVSLNSINQEKYASLIDDMTESSLQQVTGLDEQLLDQIQLKAAVLYPASSTQSELIWISETKLLLDELAPVYYKPFEQNSYQFNGITIHRLHINATVVFAVQAHNWLVFSSSSRAVESALRAYLGLGPSIDLDRVPQPGNLIINTEHIDHWVQQFVAVGYRPYVMNSFTGFKPATLTFSSSGEESPAFELAGTLVLKDTTKSTLVKALSSRNAPITLDRYIASNSAAFILFRQGADQLPQMPEFNPSPLDTALINDSEIYRDLGLAMSHEFAFVAFPESGLLANGEFLFMRKLQNVNAFRNYFEQFADSGLVIKQGNSFYVKSEILARLIGSDMATFSDFYLSFSRDVAVISKRRGLSESVESDRVRRRTIYYDETYTNAKGQMPADVSGMVWTRGDDFLKFVDPFLMTRNKLDGLLGAYDITSMVFSKNENANTVNFSFKSITQEGSTQPYNELWVLPLLGDELAGAPVFGNIIGSSADEIIFSTVGGKVEALAFDGTSVMQARTNTGDVPIGSPVLYDWYGNGQPVILQAAGTKIYAWNEGGNPLPQFPIELGERVSAPIVVTDVLRNGIPEIIVATENRKIHIIDGRGQNVRGWPQFTNAVVTKAPVYAQVDGSWSLWVFSQNILHSWLRNGQVRPGYPTFVNATFTTSPVIFDNQVLGAASDGYIYSIGKSPSFSDSLAISIQMDSVSIKSLYATSSQLNALTVEPNVLLRDSSRFYRSDLYVTQSINGSVLMFNPKGELELTHSLGQPSSATLAPFIVDLDRDGNQDMVALADFGRLFAWEMITDRRIFDIPTSGMTYPRIADLNGDGLNELIAVTREGLRCWTINKRE